MQTDITIVLNEYPDGNKNIAVSNSFLINGTKVNVTNYEIKGMGKDLRVTLTLAPSSLTTKTIE
jgi:hypothetical protein